MTLKIYTDHEKLRVIERVILMELDKIKRGRASTDAKFVVDILGSIAKDLRGRSTTVRSELLVRLEGKMRDFKGSHGARDRSEGIGIVIVTAWPTIRQALLHFDEVCDGR